MYAPRPSTSTDLPYTNGHLSPPSLKPETSTAIGSDSDSALSEAVDDPAVLAPTDVIPSMQRAESSASADLDDMSSQDEDALGSDDPDYSMETPPPQQAESSQGTRSVSQDSPRQRKRKAGTENEDYMLNNPELYGLRRSVSINLTRLLP